MWITPLWESVGSVDYRFGFVAVLSALLGLFLIICDLVEMPSVFENGRVELACFAPMGAWLVGRWFKLWLELASSCWSACLPHSGRSAWMIVARLEHSGKEQEAGMGLFCRIWRSRAIAREAS